MKIVIDKEGNAFELPYGSPESYYTGGGKVIVDLPVIPGDKKELIRLFESASTNGQQAEPEVTNDTHMLDEDDEDESRT